MIGSIKDRQTQKIWKGEASKKLPREIQVPAREALRVIDSMPSFQVLWAFPGYKAKKLGGDRDGQWSIRLNDQWRICFDWDEERAIASNVEITDYH